MDQTLLSTYDYDIWGNPKVTEEADSFRNAFRYAGEYWDSDTGLQYLRARWYDPSTGRFITEDTWEGRINHPDSQNPYVYVVNNPLRYIDSSGQNPAALAAAAGGALYGAVVNGVKAAIKGENVGAAIAGGMVDGAISGLGAGLGRPVEGGALGGYLGSVTEQYLSSGKVSQKEALLEGASGGATAGLGDTFGLLKDLYETYN